MVQLTLILMIGDDERWVVGEVDDPCFLMLPMFFLCIFFDVGSHVSCYLYYL